MAETLIQSITKTTEGKRLYEQERAILEVTELICEIMGATGISRSELAKKLGKTKGYITQLLDGDTNMTVRTISDVFTALGKELHFSTEPCGYPTGVSWTFPGQSVFSVALLEEELPCESSCFSAA